MDNQFENKLETIYLKFIDNKKNEKDGNKNYENYFELVDLLNNKENINKFLNILEKHNKPDYGYFKALSTFDKFREFINPKLFVETYIETLKDNENFRNYRFLFPKKISDDLDDFFNIYEPYNKNNKKIILMEKELNDFQLSNKKSFGEIFDSMFLKAKNIFEDQVKPLKEEQKKYFENNKLQKLENNLKLKIDSLTLESLNDLNCNKYFSGNKYKGVFNKTESIKEDPKSYNVFLDEDFLKVYNKEKNNDFDIK